MLTGDKLETAICIAKSSMMVSRLQDIYVFQTVTDRGEAHLELNSLRRKNEAALIISGDSLQVNIFLNFKYHLRNIFLDIRISIGIDSRS